MTEHGISNQDEVTRHRIRCFKKGKCLGHWQDSYTTLKLDTLINLLQAKRNPDLKNTIKYLKELI